MIFSKKHFLITEIDEKFVFFNERLYLCIAKK